MTDVLLVVAHEGYRNGATLVLRNLLPRVVELLDVDVQVEVQTEGPLAGELRDLATIVDPDRQPDLVLVNSALAAARLGRVPRETPALVYVHEVGEALDRLPSDAVAGLRRADRVLCVSERGRRDVAALGVDASRIGLLPPLITAGSVDPDAVEAARAELLGAGATDATLVVAACGEATWRKGADLFVDLVRSLPADVHGVWIGRRNRAFAKQLDHDTDLAGVGHRLTWLGEVADPMAFLAASDAFVLTSREDPQPLVPLEAAMAGTPTVGFDGTGLGDLAAVGGAAVVPYPDVAGLARRVVDLLDDPGLRSTLVDGARRLVAEERSWESLAPRLAAELQSIRDRPGPDHPHPAEHP